MSSVLSASCVRRGLQPRSKSSRTITREGDHLVRPRPPQWFISPDIRKISRPVSNFSLSFSLPRLSPESIFCFFFDRSGLFGK